MVAVASTVGDALKVGVAVLSGKAGWVCVGARAAVDNTGAAELVGVGAGLIGLAQACNIKPAASKILPTNNKVLIAALFKILSLAVTPLPAPVHGPGAH